MNIILLSNIYPYGSEEVIVEKEINYLSTLFDNVLVVACQTNKNFDELRNLPNNVSSCCSVINNSKLGKVINCIKGCRFLFSNDKHIRNELSKCDNIFKLASFLIYEQYSQQAFKKIKKSNEFKKVISEPFVIYSFWMYYPARIGLLIDQHFHSQKILGRIHGYDLYEYRTKLNYLPYRDLFYSRFDQIYACSLNGQQYLREKYPVFKNNFFVSYLGSLDYGVTNLNSSTIFKLVSCSRVIKLKRLNLLVDALSKLEDTKLNIEWTHFGDGEELSNLKQYAKQKLKTIKYLFKGYVHNSEVMDMYKKNEYDVFINLSNSEGLPVSIMEALSMSIPVIATNAGGTNEIVINNFTGTLLSIEFATKDLIDALLYFNSIKNTDKFKEYKHNCRNYWQEKFNAETNYNDFYKDIILLCSNCK